MYPKALLILAGLALLPLGAIPSTPLPQPAPVRPRILITNDNGIDDPKLVALARAFAARAETWVVAPAKDQSGTGSAVKIPRAGAVAVKRRDLGAGIQAFAVDGYPADCVLVATVALMGDRLPDLVVSGINGGANLGADWMFSGTVGAARIAAFGGLPAIAVSGLDDDIPGAVATAVDWVVKFAEHSTVKDLRPGEYLTVSLPRVAPSKVRGVRIADRAPLWRIPEVQYDEDAGICKMSGMGKRDVVLAAIADERLHAEGYIVVVPMRVDEVHGARLLEWMRSDPALPAWPVAGGKR